GCDCRSTAGCGAQGGWPAARWPGRQAVICGSSGRSVVIASDCGVGSAVLPDALDVGCADR
ncbi:hypothetical protein, partial [Tritonibacter sp. SIMBA_163]|uniref:hypothetical protein n=1 Tax=Tritonibacter sp. SIMBA_163 TaxID=3080868 RepID=UPI00397EF481